MNELQIFQNPEFGSIRTTIIDDEPWFVGKDVAMSLGYAKPSVAISKRIDDEDRGVSEMETPSGKQKMTIINESGLYCLILSSKLESAKKFKRWVTSEVLPTLRKTGAYFIPQARQRDLTTDDYLRAAHIVSRCKNERLPYVLDFLNKAGFDVSEIQKQKVITRNYNIINDSALGFLQCCEDVQVEGTPTNIVYAKYQDYCTEHNLGLLNKGEFSKQVKRQLGLSIVDKKIQGKKYRIFVNE
jgi:prophage antirepressor-like protein